MKASHCSKNGVLFHLLLQLSGFNKVIGCCGDVFTLSFQVTTDNFSLLFTEPVVEAKLHEARKMITNEKIELFNSIVGEML